MCIRDRFKGRGHYGPPPDLIRVNVKLFDQVRKAVTRQVGGSFIFGDLSQTLWKKMMLKHIDLFVTRFFKLFRPIRNPGIQLHLLRGEGNWKEENVEAFFDPAVGVLGSDGLPKANPLSIYDPKQFPPAQPISMFLLPLPPHHRTYFSIKMFSMTCRNRN